MPHPSYDVLADGVMIRPNGRSNSSSQILGAAAKLFRERPDGDFRCPAHGPLPTGMNEGHSPLERIKEKDGQAICESHDEGDGRIRSQDNVCLRSIRRRWAVSPQIVGGVDLPDEKGRFRWSAEHLQTPILIAPDACLIIANRASKIQPRPRLRALSARTGENGLCQ